MKHLKSTSSDLRRLFEKTISIREITEPLTSFDSDRDISSIKAFMEAHNYDVVGLREGGVMTGYLCLHHLKEGPAINSMVRFEHSQTIGESEPLLTAIQRLRSRRQLFVTFLGSVGGIVTKGDLQKTPTRLWLFGLISLIEMQMLRVIRQRLPEGQWERFLPQPRLVAARKVFAERQRRNEEINASDFSDCLQICDKCEILLKDSELWPLLGFSSRTGGQRFFSALESLRNDLAHANDILRGRWPELADWATQGEDLLTRLEAYRPKEVPSTTTL